VTAPGRRPLVLVADDDRDTRELYRACFDMSGYRTGEAWTGSQAIVSALEILPDVLLTDYVLPDIDGVTIARRLKADPRSSGIHIVMVTGYASPDLQRLAEEAGIDRVLLKPCLPQAVLREVSRTLARPVVRKIPRPAVLPSLATVREVADVPAVSRVRDEFAALPGLLLTTEQARLIFELDHDLCERVLHALVAEGFLSRSAHGAFSRPH
jgi:two-component system cell cycle response regulator DivK